MRLSLMTQCTDTVRPPARSDAAQACMLPLSPPPLKGDQLTHARHSPLRKTKGVAFLVSVGSIDPSGRTDRSFRVQLADDDCNHALTMLSQDP